MDIAGWTLPLQMGVNAVAVVNQFEADTVLLKEMPKLPGILHGVPEPVAFLFKNQTNVETIAVNRLLNQSVVEGESGGNRNAFLVHPENDYSRGIVSERFNFD